MPQNKSYKFLIMFLTLSYKEHYESRNMIKESMRGRKKLLKSYIKSEN